MKALSEGEVRFARNLAALRRACGLSQQALSDILIGRGFSTASQAALSQIEIGGRALRLAEARTIADFFGLSVDALCDPIDDDEVAQVVARLLATDAMVDRAAEAYRSRAPLGFPPDRDALRAALEAALSLTEEVAR